MSTKLLRTIVCLPVAALLFYSCSQPAKVTKKDTALSQAAKPSSATQPEAKEKAKPAEEALRPEDRNPEEHLREKELVRIEKVVEIFVDGVMGYLERTVARTFDILISEVDNKDFSCEKATEAARLYMKNALDDLENHVEPAVVESKNLYNRYLKVVPAEDKKRLELMLLSKGAHFAEMVGERLANTVDHGKFERFVEKCPDGFINVVKDYMDQIKDILDITNQAPIKT